MPNLVFAVWSDDAALLANESVTNRINRLNIQIQHVIAQTQPSFIVFVGAEFLFMHANTGGTQLRWYTPQEREAALGGMAASSRQFARLLLVGGTICWAKAVSHFIGKAEWKVRNEAPVYYNGQLLTLYGKRFEGGEVSGEDSLRLYNERRGNLDLDMYVVDTPDELGNNRYKVIQAAGNMRQLAFEALPDLRRGPGGTRLPAAPGLKKALDRYQSRIHFVPGTDDPSFSVPGGNFTGGVEICQEHNGPGQTARGTLQANSSRGATNFHILTSNTVGHHPGYENLRSPGYFVHAKAGCPPELIELQGVNQVPLPANQWQQIHPTLSVAELPMPPGL